jgi:hypothetical protein
MNISCVGQLIPACIRFVRKLRVDDGAGAERRHIAAVCCGWCEWTKTCKFGLLLLSRLEPHRGVIIFVSPDSFAVRRPARCFSRIGLATGAYSCGRSTFSICRVINILDPQQLVRHRIRLVLDVLLSRGAGYPMGIYDGVSG